MMKKLIFAIAFMFTVTFSFPSFAGNYVVQIRENGRTTTQTYPAVFRSCSEIMATLMVLMTAEPIFLEKVKCSDPRGRVSNWSGNQIRRIWRTGN